MKSADQKPIPIKIKVASIETVKSYFEEKTGMYNKSDLQTLLDELRVFASLVERQIETAPEVVPIKPVKRPPVSV